MSKEMDDLVVAVKANSDVEDSAILLLQTLGPLIVDAAGDRAKSIALGNEVTAKAAALADAVVAGTPAAPTP